MKHVGIAIILFASLSCAQEAGDFRPSSTNVWGAEYPRVDSAGRVQIRVKAPDATKVRLIFLRSCWICSQVCFGLHPFVQFRQQEPVAAGAVAKRVLALDVRAHCHPLAGVNS